MLSRRQLLGGLLVSGVAGCATNDNMTYNMVVGTLTSKGPPTGEYPISPEQIRAIPYATLGVRLEQSPRVVMVLATVDGKALRWVSADHVILITGNGWLLRTRGLRRDLTATRWLQGTDQQDLLRSFAQTGVLPSRGIYREIDLGHADEQGIAVESRFEGGKDETITILGKEHPTLRVDEIANMRAWRWEVRNSFWINPQTGRVLRSVQHYCPEMPRLELELLKAPAAI